MPVVRAVTSLSDLQQIKSLQDLNLRKNIDELEADSQGFVSAEYSLEFLERMHNECPSIVAEENGKIVGYALVCTREAAREHALLFDLVSKIDGIMYEGKQLADASYVVVGQLCVAKGYRGKGLAGAMYDSFREMLHKNFDYCITDVARENERSLRAHINTGFTVIDQLSYGGLSWNIVLWDWTKL